MRGRSNLRVGAAGTFVNAVMLPAMGQEAGEERKEKTAKSLHKSLKVRAAPARAQAAGRGAAR